MTARRIRAFVSNPVLQLGVPALILLFTWWMLFGGVQIATWSLMPYDGTLAERHPPLGTLERSLNDFFESPPGSNLPAALVVGTSIILLVVALLRIPGRSGERAKLVLGFAAMNFIVSIGMFVCILADLPLNLTPYPGYGWTLKFLIPQSLCLVLLFAFQAWLIPSELRHASPNAPNRSARWS